jgi:very-short-patch-repair endonuclease
MNIVNTMLWMKRNATFQKTTVKHAHKSRVIIKKSYIGKEQLLVMRYYCSVCKETISERVYSFSMDKFGKALCINHQKAIAPRPPAPKIPQPQIYASQGYSCSVCKDNISNQVYDYSMNHFGAALCRNHQKTVTPHALKLSNALNNMDVKHTLEYNDGFKHVDIAIEWAKLYLELDGSQHAFSPKQMCTDDERDKHSLRDGFVTKRIPNIWIDKDADKLALSVATLANKRYREILENDKKFTFTGFMKTVISTARKLSEKLENFE